MLAKAIERDAALNFVVASKRAFDENGMLFVGVNSNAQDDAAAQRLWDVSEKLLASVGAL